MKLTNEEVLNVIKTSPVPDEIIIPVITWKYLLRSVLRGKNILILGHSGIGKTVTAMALKTQFPKRPFEKFNLGATQEPRSFLIGNTHYDPAKGTFFGESLFVKMIQVPNAIILLDELSRAHPEAWNILMTVLDEKQRYLRIDERPDTPTIKVADGVSFVSTANIGGEYTSTRVLDRALKDRFTIIQMVPLTKDEEVKYLTKLFPDVDIKMINNIAEIADHTRQEIVSDQSKLDTMLSTRSTIELTSLLNDGFTLAEAVEVSVYPLFSAAGGTASPQSYMRKYIQQYLPTDLDNTDNPVTTEEDDEDDDLQTNKVPWKQNKPVV